MLVLLFLRCGFSDKINAAFQKMIRIPHLGENFQDGSMGGRVSFEDTVKRRNHNQIQ